VGALAALGLFVVGQHALPLTAAAQQPGARNLAPLQGVVVDELTFQPVQEATVSLVDEDLQTQTGRFGGFVFPDTPLGLMWIRVTAPGHPSVMQRVEVKQDRIVFVRFMLPSVTAVLTELLVNVPGNQSTAELASQVGRLTAADMLAFKVPSTRVTDGDPGNASYAVRLRASGTSFQLNTEALIVIDGVMISGHQGRAMEALRQIPASEVADLKVLRGPAAAFLYPFAANGVVVVTTRGRSGGR
jgi:hypothetical protein